MTAIKTTEPTAAEQAASFLRENDERTDLEQTVLDAMDGHYWILHHAHTPSLGVVLLLSRLGLLRDKAHEQYIARLDLAEAERRSRHQIADRTAIRHFDALAEQAADKLSAGEDPAEVAAWMRAIRQQINTARDEALSTQLTPAPTT
ncbi:hypothetical protein [Kitasatospora indigofera]|uniref:hypothetical protein n=1 Tax=Kitasatospora indigofera TaxID=67307 RepID=UPI0036961AFD